MKAGPAYCPGKTLATPVTPSPGADLQLRVAQAGRPALCTIVTRKDLVPDPASKVPHVWAWEVVPGPLEGWGERQGQVQALMAAGPRVHSASRLGPCHQWGGPGRLVFQVPSVCPSPQIFKRATCGWSSCVFLLSSS